MPTEREEAPSHGSHGHDQPMSEGEEPPPPGVKSMAVVRWALLALSALLALFVWWSYANDRWGNGAGEKMQVAQVYHCPMHPQITSNAPGECPICHMRLEPSARRRGASAQAKQAPLETPDGAMAHGPIMPGSTPPGTTPVTLTLDRMQAIGVRTAVVQEADTSQKLRATAIVEPAEQGAAEVHVRSPGFVEKIMVNQTGVHVAAGQPLFALYSPEIFQAQGELVATASWAGSSGVSSSTADSARRKLALLGMSERDIERVAASKQPLRAIVIEAPQSGFVIKKNVVLGSYVVSETTLYEIQDLSRVYVVADVFQPDVGYLHKGTVGSFVPSSRAGEALQARVDLIYPTLNAEARTTRVRLVLPSPKDAPLRPGEYGVVEFATPGRKLLSVPRDAVVDTGLATYVFTVESEGQFSPKAVVLGPEHGQDATIVAGVQAGERVVSGATFLIDSESRLQASAQGAPAEPRK